MQFYFFREIEDLDLLQTNLRIDYKMALEMTYGILILEVIHRVIVCIFEVRDLSAESREKLIELYFLKIIYPVKNEILNKKI